MHIHKLLSCICQKETCHHSDTPHTLANSFLNTHTHIGRPSKQSPFNWTLHQPENICQLPSVRLSGTPTPTCYPHLSLLPSYQTLTPLSDWHTLPTHTCTHTHTLTCTQVTPQVLTNYNNNSMGNTLENMVSEFKATGEPREACDHVPLKYICKESGLCLVLSTVLRTSDVLQQQMECGHPTSLRSEAYSRPQSQAGAEVTP